MKTLLRYKQLIILAIIFVFVTISIVSVTSAKYTATNKVFRGVTASDFYISSKFLEEVTTENLIGAEYEYYAWPSSITVDLNNWDANNTLSYTHTDILYNVNVEGATFDDLGHGQIRANETTPRQTSNIIVTPISNDIKQITITINVYEPYVKVFKAVLTFSGAFNESYYEVVDGLFYYELIVYAAEDLENITIRWPSNVIPDNNNIDVDMAYWQGN